MTEEEEEEEGCRWCLRLSRAAQDPCHSYEVGKPQWGPGLAEPPGEIWVLVASMGMLLTPGFACGEVCGDSRAGDSECYKSVPVHTAQGHAAEGTGGSWSLSCCQKRTEPCKAGFWPERGARLWDQAGDAHKTCASPLGTGTWQGEYEEDGGGCASL